jgi:hypothetical protein
VPNASWLSFRDPRRAAFSLRLASLCRSFLRGHPDRSKGTSLRFAPQSPLCIFPAAGAHEGASSAGRCFSLSFQSPLVFAFRCHFERSEAQSRNLSLFRATSAASHSIQHVCAGSSLTTRRWLLPFASNVAPGSQPGSFCRSPFRGSELPAPTKSLPQTAFLSRRRYRQGLKFRRVLPRRAETSPSPRIVNSCRSRDNVWR